MLNRHKTRSPGDKTKVALGILIGWLSVLACAEQALAIPTFSRKYRTSCITCHTIFPRLTDTGEAFRRNGYQFPSGEEILVKDEPISFGGDAYKEMFPNSVWPSDMPTLPPVFIRAQQRMIFKTGVDASEKRWDQDYPHEIALGGAATFGNDISAWWEVEWEPKDGHGAGVERAFVNFTNLFAWSAEDDEDGMREGNRWLTLPRHALNVRIGKMQTSVIPQWASQHGRVNIQQALPIRQRIGANRFRFEPAQSAAIEVHGIIKQYNSYAFGFANGGIVSGGQLDDNTHKDVYFRVARKWFGFPLDGVIGSVASDDDADAAEGDQGLDDVPSYPQGLDWYRAWGLETGFFGWWGQGEIPAETREVLGSVPVVGDPLDIDTETVFPAREDNFRRIGFDARLQWYDLDIYGLAYWGHDSFAGRLSGVDLGVEDHFSYFIEADYMIKPWILAFVRHEQTHFDTPARATKENVARTIPGVVFLIRQNLKLQTEVIMYNDARNNAKDEIRLQLDYSY